MTILNFIAVLLYSTTVMTGCDYDIYNPEQVVPQAALTKVQETYPDAHVTWEREGAKYKADIQNGVADIDMWFSSKGVWERTETDFTEELPAAVMNYISTKYPGYHIDDVDWIETPKQKYFKIELERGERDIRLRIKEDGTLVK